VLAAIKRRRHGNLTSPRKSTSGEEGEKGGERRSPTLFYQTREELAKGARNDRRQPSHSGRQRLAFDGEDDDRRKGSKQVRSPSPPSSPSRSPTPPRKPKATTGESGGGNRSRSPIRGLIRHASRGRGDGGSRRSEARPTRDVRRRSEERSTRDVRRRSEERFTRDVRRRSEARQRHGSPRRGRSRGGRNRSRSRSRHSRPPRGASRSRSRSRSSNRRSRDRSVANRRSRSRERSRARDRSGPRSRAVAPAARTVHGAAAGTAAALPLARRRTGGVGVTRLFPSAPRRESKPPPRSSGRMPGSFMSRCSNTCQSSGSPTQPRSGSR
jgi:hypothetical protein